MTERLRYTGSHVTNFKTGNVGQVDPQGEFDVPDDLLVAFIRRPDIEHAGPCPRPPCVCGDEPQAEPERPKRRQAKPQQDATDHTGVPMSNGGGDPAPDA